MVDHDQGRRVREGVADRRLEVVRQGCRRVHHAEDPGTGHIDGWDGAVPLGEPVDDRDRGKITAREQPGLRIRINGDVFAPFRSIVQVLDACQGEGLTVVGINTAVDIKSQKQ